MANWLKHARSSQPRRARNYTQKFAQRRLDETIAPFHEQVENALYVDSNLAVIFHKCETGRPCTCSHDPVSDEVDQSGSNQGEGPTLVSERSDSNGMSFEMVDNDDIFGEPGQQARPNMPDMAWSERKAKEIEAGDLILSDGMHRDQAEGNDPVISAFDDGLFSGSSINCGICYSRGIVPAFNPTGYTWVTFTNYNIIETSSYNVDQSFKPFKMMPQSEGCWIKFAINVPKYFSECKYSVRDNLTVISGATLYVDPAGKIPLNKGILNSVRGKTIEVYVVEEEFTHVSIYFQQDSDPLRVNVSQENESLDYTRSSTIGQLNVIAPARIGMVRNSDILVLPERHLVLKVNDAPRKTTSRRTVIEWELTCRALQGSEALSGIFEGRKVY